MLKSKCHIPNICRASDCYIERSDDGKRDTSLVFDKNTGQFIVTVSITPEVYGKIAGEGVIADLDSLVFDKEIGLFVVKVYMSPEEYGKYALVHTLPSR